MPPKGAKRKGLHKAIYNAIIYMSLRGVKTKQIWEVRIFRSEQDSRVMQFAKSSKHFEMRGNGDYSLNRSKISRFVEDDRCVKLAALHDVLILGVFAPEGGKKES